MLKEILSITGKPGLFKILSSGNNMLIVEDLLSRKRLPVHSRDKVVSLGDIAMYTESGDTPLGEILDKVYEYNKGEKMDVKGLVAEKKLRDTFKSIIADFDQDRVYDNDIKKLFTWYNILLEAGFTKFVEEEETETAEEQKSAGEQEEEKEA